MLLGALEAGGTKMVMIVGDEKGNIFERVSLPTILPDVTLPAIIDFFKTKEIAALGIGSFGPVQLDENADNYGYITTTPKQGWQHCNIRGILADALHVPVGIDTDVNAAALAEHTMGAGVGFGSLAYFTVGTGVGAGFYTNGGLVHGLVHPEFGHILLRPHIDDMTPRGFCPYHDGCLEALASGSAIEKRWGTAAVNLPIDHIAWKMEAYYLAQACITSILTVSPEIIVLGGGVMHQEHLFPMIHDEVISLLAGYIQHDAILKDIKSYIVPPKLGDNSGAIGSLMLGLQML